MNMVYSKVVSCRLLFFVVGLVVLIGVSPVNAKPALQALSPRAIQIGSTTELTASGTFAKWPVKVWVDRPGLEFKVGDKGKITVTAKKEVPPGVYLIRLMDSTGASEPVPLVVDFAATELEKEPNESPKQSNELKTPVNVSGVLGKSGDVDCFQVECRKGQRLFARVRANPLFGLAMDGVVQVCDERGFVLDQNDDKLGIDPQLEIDIPRDGLYFVRIFAFPATPNSTVRFAGGADYRYLLTISNGETFLHPENLTDKQKSGQDSLIGLNLAPDTVVSRIDLGQDVLFYSNELPGFFELEKSGNDSKLIQESKNQKDSVLQVPFDLTGVISQKGELDLYRIKGVKGKKIRFQVDARKLGFELDPVLTVFDAEGKSLLNKDDNSKTDPDLVADFTPAKDGVYFVRIKDSADAGGSDYFYRLRAEPVEPDFELTVAASSFELKDGKVEIEVVINRKDGFSQPIELQLNGLGDDLEVPSVKSEPKGDSSKKIKLTLESKTNFQKIVRIEGRTQGQSRYATFNTPSNRKLDRFVITSETPKK